MRTRKIIHNFARTVVLILTFAMLTACGKYTKHDSLITISTESVFYGNTLSIEVTGRNCIPGDGYVTFHSNCSMNDLFSSLQLDDTITAQRVHDAILLTKQSGEFVEHYCISKAAGVYLFGGMRGNLITDITEEGRQQRIILLPVHLVRDELILNGSSPFYTLYANVDYKAYGSFEDFQDFYLGCGWYDVECKDNYIFITKEKQSIQGPFTVRLAQKEDGLYFAIVTD